MHCSPLIVTALLCVPGFGVVGACAGGPAAVPASHQVLLRVRKDAVLPKTDYVLPPLTAVVWLNETGDRVIHVSVSPVSEQLLHCSSTFSFEVQEGVARTPKGIMMNGTAVTESGGALKAGQILRISAVGSSDAAVRFDIGRYRTGIPMRAVHTTQSNRGKRSNYVGSYIVQRGEKLKASPVYVSISRKVNGRLFSRRYRIADTLLEIDA